MPAPTDVHQHPPAPARSRRWPLTAAVVLLGWCLIGWTVFAAGINTAPFFGDTPSRDRYVESGMACFTAVVPLVLLLVLAVLCASRWGLLLLALPTVGLLPLGLSMLGQPGDPADPRHARPVVLSDAFTGLTGLSWGAAVVLLLVLAGVVFVRRRTARRARASTT